MIRTVKIVALSDDEIRRVHNETGRPAFEAALGDLSAWGIDLYPCVEIVLMPPGIGMIATYHDADGTRRGFRTARWAGNLGRFTFNWDAD